MMTASHMPYQNNGMKFFTAEGGLAKPDITEILASAAERAAAAGVQLGEGLQVRWAGNTESSTFSYTCCLVSQRGLVLKVLDLFSSFF